MKIKTSELEGVALDWAVAMAEGKSVAIGIEKSYVEHIPLSTNKRKVRNEIREPYLIVAVARGLSEEYSPSTDWSQGGPLQDKYLCSTDIRDRQNAEAQTGCGYPDGYGSGPDVLIAICRAIVAHKLGDTVDVPEELL